MNKNEIKGFAKGVMASALTIALIGTASAVVGSQSITAAYNNIKIVVDGSAITPKDASGNTVEPFVYNGTTYLPVRAIATALGKEVTWDSSANTVYLGTVPSGTTISNSVPGSSSNRGSGTIGDYIVSIDSASLSTDSVGNSVAIITYSWTNNSSQDTMFNLAFNRSVLQNGVGLSWNTSASKNYTCNNVWTTLAPGATDKVQEAYTLKNTVDSITVELSDRANNTDKSTFKKVLSIN